MSYWRIIEANAAMRREAAFERWRASRYHDKVAQEQFLAMFVAANAAAAQARRVGA
jgi:hypothetical protein